MSFTLSRLMSAATASYGVYALAEPRHLGRALTDDPADQSSYDVLAQTYGLRDVAVGSVGMLGTRGAVRTAMLLRILFDISDGALLATRTFDTQTRQKVLGVTLGWAALNATALAVDSRRAKR